MPFGHSKTTWGGKKVNTFCSQKIIYFVVVSSVFLLRIEPQISQIQPEFGLNLAWKWSENSDQFRPNLDQMQTKFRPHFGQKHYFYRVFWKIWSEFGLNLVWIWSEFGLHLVWIWSELVWIFRPFSGQIQAKFRLNLADLGLNSKKKNTRNNKKVNYFLGAKIIYFFASPSCLWVAKRHPTLRNKL